MATQLPCISRLTSPLQAGGWVWFLALTQETSVPVLLCLSYLGEKKSLSSTNVPSTLLSGLATSEVATPCVMQENMRKIKSMLRFLVLVIKNPPASAGDARNAGLISGLGRSPGKGNGNPLQYSCLENSVDRRAWQATVQGMAKSQTWLSTEHTSKLYTYTYTCIKNSQNSTVTVKVFLYGINF